MYIYDYMAGVSRGQIAKEILLKLKKDGWNTVSIEQLRSAIIMRATGSENTITQYLSIMRQTGMINETAKGWEILINE